MMWTVLAALALFLALIPAVLYARNVRLYQTPPLPCRTDCQSVLLSRTGWQSVLQPVSVLIPARNEERSIAAALEAVLSSRGIEFEVVVLDDHSVDATAAIVESYARKDSRVRLEKAPPLPEGWCGKQHACFALSKLARHGILVFVDADVRLEPDGLARLVGFLESSGAALVSGFPRQETETWLEKLVIPLIHFLLLGLLPIHRMRKSVRPCYAAGCGQLFVSRRQEYERVGGHATVKSSLHDGITLPRAYRRAGLMTDLCDATAIATCRMYRSAAEVWFGLAKNAREGLASARLIVPITLLLLAGQVLPFALFILFLAQFADALALAPDVDLFAAGLEKSGIALRLTLSALAVLASYYPRWDAVKRFRQSLWGALLHPLGITALLAIQWYALARWIVGVPSGWKGRKYPSRQAASG